MAIRRVVTGLVLMGLASSVVSCTPRPDTGEEVLGAFFKALGSGELSEAAAYTDHPEAAEAELSAAVKGLQTHDVTAQVDQVTSDGSQSTAQVAMNWQLPSQRTWSYDTTFVLTRAESGAKEWTVRWTSATLHPSLGRNQHPELRSIPAPQPSVVGSDGAPLLVPGEVHRIVMDRDSVANVQSTINRIATIVNNEFPAPEGQPPRIDARALGADAAQGAGAYSVAVLPAETPARVKEELGTLPGVSVNSEAAMVRPDPGFAPDLMSRVEKLVGQSEPGENGWQVVAANRDGAVLDTLYQVEPQVVPAVQASISKKVQDAAQQAVDTRSDAEAMLVAIQPSTGKILAVAQTSKADEKGDLALMGQFPPGSTYKIVTAAAGMAREGLNAGSTVGCPGTMAIGPRVVTNYNGTGSGDTSLTTAFARSCNTTFAEIAHGFAPGDFQADSKKFGIGIDYRIAGLDTITGSVSDGTDEAERIDAGYGQGNDLVSPFGMALVSATVAAGRTPTPTLIPAAGTWQSASSPQLDPHVIDNLRTLMRAVVTSGTGTAIAGRGEIYAKTGEAEVNGGSHAWFTGYRGDLAFATLITYGGGSEHAVAVTDHFFANLDEGTAEDVNGEG